MKDIKCKNCIHEYKCRFSGTIRENCQNFKGYWFWSEIKVWVAILLFTVYIGLPEVWRRIFQK